MKRKVLMLILLMITISFLYVNASYAGVFLNSAHGNSTYGVDRNAAGFPSDYPNGHCAHCHEQHASIGGSQPSPVGSGPSEYSLFDDNYVSQTDGICFECHKDAGSYQSGGNIINRSYSYRAGGWTADPVNDILESFSFSSPDSSHNLDDIKTEMTEQSWGYTSDSNPCNACHNPHAAQGDPANAPNTAKTSGTRGYPVSRPSQHSTDNNAWGLWGDGAGEKMSDYTSFYQAPYRYNSTSSYEPDGSPASDASKLTDYVTFCTDCHDNSNTISSTPLGRNLHKFNWSVEKHGGGTASDACADIFDPYFTDGNCGNYVLACTDCHEPHGSPNIFLIRKVVNGGVVTVDTGTGTGPEGNQNKEWVYLCQNCHDGLLSDSYHVHPSSLPGSGFCASAACHYDVDEYRPCGECHFHGNNEIDSVPYGEQLF